MVCDKWRFLLPLLSLPAVVPQGFDTEVWGEWDSVSCYACGLAAIDPESDIEGSYGTNPNEGKKMYNHSCDLMDNALKSPPVYEFAGQELNPRNHVKKVPWPAPGKAVLWPLGHPRNGTQKCTNVTTVVDSATETVFDETLNATVPKKENLTTCELEWEQGFDTEKLPPKEYDLNMWVRKCPKGVRSCFRAQGNWAAQRPVFRGCAGARYAHGTTCRRELQRVQTEPGRPKVDVEVYLCYCTGDECNQRTIAGSANTNMLRLGGFVSTMINYSLIAALTLLLID